MGSLPDWAVEGLMVLGGLFFIYEGVKDALVVRASRSWPITIGTVTNSRRSTGRAARATIHYSYTVGENDYEDTFSLPITDLSVLERLAAQYLIDGPVDVHYNPRNPAQSVVESEQGVSWLTLLLGVVIAGGGTFFLVAEYVVKPR